MNRSIHPALKGKTALITGGSGVLCSAMARELARQGVTVALVGRTLSRLEAVADEINSAGYEAIAMECDVLDRGSLASVRDRVAALWGGLDILVNGAGGNSPKASTGSETWAASREPGTPGSGFFDLDPEGFRDVLDLNFMGSFLPVQILGPLLLGREGASIINISSMGSFSPMTKVPAYCAAKAAINNFTSWLAVHFADAGIRVNAIAPGFFSTEQNRTLLWNPDGTPTPRTGKILTHTPMRRLGDPRDLTGSLLWLCDPVEAAFVTGVVIPVDGGFMAYSGV